MCVCVKGTGGGQYALPPLQKRARTPCVRGSLWPSAKRKETRIRTPALTREGWWDDRQSTSAQPSTRASRKSVAANAQKVGKQKPQKRIDANTLAASRPRKKVSEGASKLKPRRFRENPKNVKGPDWHPYQNARRTHGQNGRRRNCSGDKKKEPDQQSAVWGVSCYYLNYISSKKRRANKHVVDTKTLR